MRVDPTGHAWWHWIIGIVVAVGIVALAIVTAGAIIAAAPAVAAAASSMVFAVGGSVALAGAAATAVSIGAAVVAVATIAIGLNEGIAALTGTNLLGNLMGQEAYGIAATIISFFGAAYIIGGATLPYPSTGDSTPQNLNEQVAGKSVASNPSGGTAIPVKMTDPRMPSWLGWQKYQQTFTMGNGQTITTHYVTNRLFPSWYPFYPWFDFKYKR